MKRASSSTPQKSPRRADYGAIAETNESCRDQPSRLSLPIRKGATVTRKPTGRSPHRIRLCTKQRSNSESFYSNKRLNANARRGRCDRSTSIAVLNREKAILKRILGPNGLFWIDHDRRQSQLKTRPSLLADDLEAQTPIESTSPLVEEQKRGRLIQRQMLFHARRDLSDVALFFALIGIVMMVVESELVANHVSERDSTLNTFLRLGVFSTTFALVGLVIRFHIYEIQLFMNAHGTEDWLIALNRSRVTQMTAEVVICAICPFPMVTATGHTHNDLSLIPKRVPLYRNVLSSLLALSRATFPLETLHRRLLARHRLNQVNFDLKFIMKTLMHICPGKIMLFFTASLWIVAAWIMRLCERFNAGDAMNVQSIKNQNYLNSLWFIAITFLSVGYGDIVPNTYCGRSMAVITGILGTCSFSIVVAVIARNLELTSSEKHVQTFMMNSHLAKKVKHAAANVLRETWLIYKNTQLVHKLDPGRIRRHQRKFLVAIYKFRRIRGNQRRLTENAVTLGDVARTSSITFELVHDVQNAQEGLVEQVTSIEQQMDGLHKELKLLSKCLRKINRECGE